MSDDSSKYPPAAVAGHPAVDLAAALLRAFGHHGLSTDKMSAQELEALCEQWARHLLIGSPPPGDVKCICVSADRAAGVGPGATFLRGRKA